MRLDELPRSDNIEDRRGDGDSGGGGFGMPMGAGGLGIGTVVVLGLIGWALGIDPRLLIGGAEVVTRPSQQTPYQPSRPGRTGTPCCSSRRRTFAAYRRRMKCRDRCADRAGSRTAPSPIWQRHKGSARNRRTAAVSAGDRSARWR